MTLYMNIKHNELSSSGTWSCRIEGHGGTIGLVRGRREHGSKVYSGERRCLRFRQTTRICTVSGLAVLMHPVEAGLVLKLNFRGPVLFCLIYHHSWELVQPFLRQVAELKIWCWRTSTVVEFQLQLILNLVCRCNYSEQIL